MTGERLNHEASPEDSQKFEGLRSSFKELYEKQDKNKPKYESEYYLIQEANENNLKPEEYRLLFRSYCIEQEEKALEQEEKALRRKVKYLFFRTERGLEGLNHSFSEADFFKVAEYVLKVVAIGSIALGLFSFFLEGAKREEQRSIEAERKEIEAEQKEISQRRSLYEAWQIITAAQGKSSNSGRREALEVLMKAHVNLEGLNLENAIISYLNLAGANLPSAQLKNLKAYQINLEKSNLKGSDLRGAFLGQANLRFAKLDGAALCPRPLNSSKEERGQPDERCQPTNPTKKTPITETLVNQTSNKQSVTSTSNLLATNNLKSSTLKVHEPISSKSQALSSLSTAKSNTPKSNIASDNSKEKFVDQKCPWIITKDNYTHLDKADLREATLTGANLSCASLRGANLSGAFLGGVTLSFTDFSGALLFGSHFRNNKNEILEEAIFKGALYDSNTEFPPDFDYKGAGAVEIKVGGELKDHNLTGANLSDTNLQEMHFTNVTFDKAVLDGSNLAKAIFEGIKSEKYPYMKMGNAKFRGANLGEAKFKGSINLTKADFSGARLEGAILKEAIICNANFKGAIYDEKTEFPTTDVCDKPKKFDKTKVGAYTIAELKQPGDFDLEGSNLSKLDLKKVDWTNKNLKGANLRGADLSGADLSGADLSGADLTCPEEKDPKCSLTGANLIGADLSNAKLDGANLSGAKLNYAIFDGASLKGTKLDGANLRYTNLKDAVHLTAQQVRTAKSIDKAKYKNDLLRKLRCHHPLEWLFKACIPSPD